jgi:hypothetical protein
MLSDEKLITAFNKNMSRFYANTNEQRREMALSYQYRDGLQSVDDPDSRQLTSARYPVKGKTYAVANMCAPIIRAVAGSEVMQANKLEYISVDESFDVDADVIDDVVEFCQYASNYYAERACAVEDAATCGIGATVTYLDLTKKDFIAGVPIVERVFPAFLAYDSSCRSGNINAKSTWAAYADAVDKEWLDEYVEDKLDGKEGVLGASDFSGFLLSYSRQQNMGDIGFIYHYFWQEFSDIYDVKNPFLEPMNTTAQPVPLIDLIMTDADSANLFGKVADELQIDWKSSFWSLDKEAFDGLKQSIEVIMLMNGLPFDGVEFSKRKGKCYYRAEFANGMLLSKGRSYTQTGHPINFITGYFDETQAVYYGMMRPLSHIQDYLNIGMSNFLEYAKSAIHGGGAYIKGAGEAFVRIKEERSNEDALTPLPANAEITPKALPQTPEVLLQFIRLMMEIMPRVLGLGQEFFGVITSGDMTESLFGRVMKQSFAVLENWKNNSASYDMHQGAIFEDLGRLLVNANNGMALPVLSPSHNNETYRRVFKQNLARNYAIRIVARPMTRDEKMETFKQLSQLAPQAQQAGVNLFPMLARYAPMDYQDQQEMIKLSTPQPQQPDPMNQATLQANIDFTNASAAKAMADARKIQAEASDIEKQVSLADDKALAEIRQKVSAAELNEAKTQETLASMAQAIVGHMDSMQAQMESKMEAMKPKEDDRLHEKLETLNRNYEEKMQQMMMTNAMLMRMDAQAEAQAQALEAQRQAVEQAAMANQELTKAMTAPRKLVRDAQGNAMGVEVQS